MRPLVFSVIGFGRFGQHYVRLLQQIKNVRLYSVVATALNSFRGSENVLSPLVKRLVHGDEAISDPLVDCVIIASPPSTHLAYIKSSAQHGKHFLVEKPMVVSPSEVIKVRRILRSYDDRCGMVGYTFLYNDHIRWIKKAIQDRILGRLRYIDFQQFNPGPIRCDINGLWEMASHEFSILDYFFGPLSIQNATGITANIGRESRGDFVSYSFFHKGIAINGSVSWFAPRKTRTITIVGDKAMIYFDDVTRENVVNKIFLSQYPYPICRGKCFSRELGVLKAKAIEIRSKEPLGNEIQNFIDCIRNRKVPLSDIEMGVRVSTYLADIEKKLKKVSSY